VGQQEVGQECEGVSRMWGRSVRGQQEVGQDCEAVSRMWGRSVRVSAGSGTGL